jgi:hypothetical protein
VSLHSAEAGGLGRLLLSCWAKVNAVRANTQIMRNTVCLFMILLVRTFDVFIDGGIANPAIMRQ